MIGQIGQLRQLLRQPFGFTSALSKNYGELVKLSSTAHFDTANSFSKSGRGSGGTEVLGKNAYRFSLCLFPPLFARSFPTFFCRSFALTESLAQAIFPLFLTSFKRPLRKWSDLYVRCVH